MSSIAIVPAPMPLTDSARRLQTRLWSISYGLDVAHAPLDVVEWVSTLYAEYGPLLTSRKPILEWPHFEPTRPATGVLTPLRVGIKLRLPPLLWLLMLDDTRCATTELKERRRGPVMACLAQLVREHGLSLGKEYGYIMRHRDNESAFCRDSEQPVPFLLRFVCHQRLMYSPLRALLALGADPNAPLMYGTKKHSPLFVALTSRDDLDGAQLLLDYGAHLDPALDAGVIWEAMAYEMNLEWYTRLVPLLALHRTALRGLENATATDLGALHRLAHDYVYYPHWDFTGLNHMTTIMHGLHVRVGVSLLTRAKPWADEDDQEGVTQTPTVLQYVRDLKDKTPAAEWERRFCDAEYVPFFHGRVAERQGLRLQELIDVLEPLERAERFSLRPLATAAELALKRSKVFGGLIPELRRIVLRSVPAWAAQPAKENVGHNIQDLI